MSISIYSRYHGLAAVEVDGRRSLTLRPIPPAVDHPDGILHTVVGGETLDELAGRYYGREDLWWRIADANPGRFPLDWRPGEVLRIPPLRLATRTPRR